MGRGAIDVFVAQLFGFFEALFLERNRTDFPKEAELAETDGAIGEGTVFDTADDGQSDGQIDSGLVDGQPSGDVDKNVLGSQGKLEVFG